MAPKPAPPPEPAPLNTALIVVSSAAAKELEPVWALPDQQGVSTALFDVLPALVDKWSLASASAAADWFDQLRELKAIKGRFTAIVPSLDDQGAEALAGWGSQPLRAEPVDLDTPPTKLSPLDSARSRVEGGLQKRIANAANETLTTSTVQDPQAHGYLRRTRPGACEFCLLVASRGAVFTRSSGTFACHENCYCTCQPAWGGEELPVNPYKPSARQSTAADRARVRRWIADNL